MADKGFNIKDLLEPIGVTLNIPPYLSEKGQFDGGEVENTQSIASVCIHVEGPLVESRCIKSFPMLCPCPFQGF